MLSGPVVDQVETWLIGPWSPEEIAKHSHVKFGDDPKMQAPAETSYKSLFVQVRASLHKELTACLRTGLAIRPQRLNPSVGKSGRCGHGLKESSRGRGPDPPRPEGR